jgi:hypothetical protein
VDGHHICYDITDFPFLLKDSTASLMKAQAIEKHHLKVLISLFLAYSISKQFSGLL